MLVVIEVIVGRKRAKGPFGESVETYTSYEKNELLGSVGGIQVNFTLPLGKTSVHLKSTGPTWENSLDQHKISIKIARFKVY